MPKLIFILSLITSLILANKATFTNTNVAIASNPPKPTDTKLINIPHNDKTPPNTINPNLITLNLSSPINGPAKLEFKAQKPNTQKKLRELLTEQWILQQSPNPNSQKLTTIKRQIINLFEPAKITEKNIIDATVQPTSTNNKYNVGLVFDNPGGKAFNKLTKKLAGKNLAIGIFLNNQLISTPIVSKQFKNIGITGGKAIIDGNFDAQSAEDLVVKLKSGLKQSPRSGENSSTFW